MALPLRALGIGALTLLGGGAWVLWGSAEDQGGPPPVPEDGIPFLQVPVSTVETLEPGASDGADSDPAPNSDGLVVSDDPDARPIWQPPPRELIEPDEEGRYEVSFEDLLLDFYEPPVPADYNPQEIMEGRRTPPSGDTATNPDDPDAPSSITEAIAKALAEREARSEEDSPFPEEIRALDGKTVLIEGYMHPVAYIDDKVSAFVLSRYLPGCCWGDVLVFDEWVQVDVLDEDGTEIVTIGTVLIEGTFHVGERIDEFGYVTSIYQLEAETITKQW